MNGVIGGNILISFSLFHLNVCSLGKNQDAIAHLLASINHKFSVLAITETCVKESNVNDLRTFAPKSSYGEIFFISHLVLVHKVLTPKMKKKMGVTDFVSEKMVVEKCLNFDKSVIITRCSLLC